MCIVTCVIDKVTSNNIKDSDKMTWRNLSEAFREGYCDGHGQAIENVRYNLLEYLNEHNKLTADDVNKICDFCAKINEEDLP